MKKNLFVIVFIIVFTVSCFGDLIKGRGRFQLEVDYARFYGDSSQVYLEFYYGMIENALAYKIDPNRFIGAANIDFKIYKQNDVVSERTWTFPHILTDTTVLSSAKRLVGIETLGLPAGDYIAKFWAYDLYDPERRDSLTISVSVTNYSREKEELSDIELCTIIRQSNNTQSLFYKNTFEVLPNAGRLYGAGLTILYYYCEVYNLAKAQRSTPVTIRTTVVDAMGVDVYKNEKSKPRTLNSSIEVGTVNLSAMKGGTYTLRLSMVDPSQVVLATTSKKFFVYRPGVSSDTTRPAEIDEYSSSEYVVMTEEEIERSFEYTKYISLERERQQFEKLTDPKAKRKFLYEFWHRRDPDPTTSVNEYKQWYDKRIEYANKNLTVGYRQGWKSERGRVYILYGPSDEIERSPSSAESNPYEIWHYNNIQGGVIFVFVDRNGMGDFLLVHSTHRDELRDENWYERYAQKMR